MQTFIEIIIGVFLAAGFVLIARRSGSFAEEKRVYAIGLLIAALIYVGFGLFSDSIAWIITETLGVPIYAVFVWLGLRKSGLLLAIGWAFHVAWDTLLHDYSTAFVPHWYINVCIGFDLLLATYIGFREIKK